MSSKACMTLALGCLVSFASLAQVTGGVLRKAPVDGQQAPQAPLVVPQVQPGLPAQQQNPQVQQIPQPQQFNAPAERKGRNQKDDKGLFGGLF